MDISSDAGAAKYRKTQHSVSVQFAVFQQEIQTLEGSVRCEPGDAIVTGDKGEQWPVPKGDFICKYVAVPPTTLGSGGAYRALPIEVYAKRITTLTRIELSGGRGTLIGLPGNWLVQYKPGEHAVVDDAIFQHAYEPIDG